MSLPLRAMLLAAVAVCFVLSASPLMAPGVRAAAPRVVIVVGPVGPVTDRYRADGEDAARAARDAGAAVTTVYSPNATWPKVKAALQGASIVVYMGHGNGFPSRYGPILRKETKDGLGLNPVGGVDDVAHQYFGEAYLARDIRLAPHAVVLLHHLCYASGNSEPGLPEGDLETGQQRVDNMAAGWLAAGAEAVLADAYGHPAHYIRRILGARSTIEAIWRTAPTAHGHVLAFASSRTPGMTALMDPTRKSSGFYRSLVVRAEMRAGEVAAGAALIGRPSGPGAGFPTPPVRAPSVSRVTLDGRPTVGAALELSMVLEDGAGATPSSFRVGVRWDPVALDRPAFSQPGGQDAPAASAAPPAAVPTQRSPSPAPLAPEAGSAARVPIGVPPSPQSSRAPVPGSATGAEPLTSANTLVVPALVSPEVLGDVVVLVDARHAGERLDAKVVAPDAPGLYRLVSSIHNEDGVALDEPGGQAAPALLVRVVDTLSALITADSHFRVAPGAILEVPVAVMNTGTVPWVKPPLAATGGERRAAGRSQPSARLVGYWLGLDPSAPPREIVAVETTLEAAPGETAAVSLRSTAPRGPGEYLLVVDVVSAIDGSLIASGGQPSVVRVTVAPPNRGSGT
jgi:hypothetical protein